jgi:DNA-binding XRE family transcriptional regulator
MVGQENTVPEQDQQHRRPRGRPIKNNPSPFADWITRSGMTRAEVATKLGISPGHLSDILNGRSKPGLETAFDIKDLTGGEIYPESWLDRK